MALDRAIPGDNKYQDMKYILDGKLMTAVEATNYLIACGFNQLEAIRYKHSLRTE